MKKRTLAEVDAYEVPAFLAERIARTHKVPSDFAAGLIEEAKRMLYLSVISGDSVAPSDRIDWAWHEMLMFTQFYKDYAKFIGGFIHHVPNPPPLVDDVDETWEEIQSTLNVSRKEGDVYGRTKANYEKYFDIKPDPLYWP